MEVQTNLVSFGGNIAKVNVRVSGSTFLYNIVI